MLAFPVLGMLLATLGAIMVSAVVGGGTYALDPAFFAELSHRAPEDIPLSAPILVYGFAITFVTTASTIYANFAVLNTMRVRLDGGDATFMDSVRAANARLGDIMKWSLIVTSVGFVLRVIESSCRRLGWVGSIVGSGITALMGGAWNVISFMVVPAMVMDGVGPREGLEHSVAALRKSWGEGLTAHVSIGFVTFMAMLPGFAMVVMGVGSLAAAGQTGGSLWLGGGFLGFAVLYAMAVSLMLSVARVLFSGALYRYARTGQIGDGYDEDLMVGAFTSK